MTQSEPAATPSRLPRAFTNLRQILSEPKQGRMVSVIGVVIDFRAPYKLDRGSDWKASVSLIDRSIESHADLSDSSLQCHFFMPQDQMPAVECGDVIVLETVKVQYYRNNTTPSLLTCHQTKFSIYSADKIPEPPGDASVAIAATPKSRSRQGSRAELDHVAFLHHNIAKDRIPTKEEFEVMQVQSLAIKVKFKELKDVTEGFCDLIVRVTREPYDLGDKICLWVTDYTENPAFFNFSDASPANEVGFQDGDIYGYTTKYGKAEQKRRSEDGAPHGQRSMQVTCWEPHASAIRDGNITRGRWVSMKNVHVKYGSNGANLEGFLREDRSRYGSNLQIFPLDTTDRENMDLRLYSAIKRYRDYEMSKRSRLKEQADIDEAAKAGQKRKSAMASEEPKNNSRARRKAKRSAEAKMSKADHQDTTLEGVQPVQNRSAVNLNPAGINPEGINGAGINGAGINRAGSNPTGTKPAGINPAVKCESFNTPPSMVSDLLQRATILTEVDGESVHLPLPFVNCNYRVDVRVTDFHPPDLCDFARKKRATEFDILSDNEDMGSETDDGLMDHSPTDCDWEWRFALQLEDATSDSPRKTRFWALVDDHAAQCLVSMEASNIKEDQQALDYMRDRMFVLWGDLEEKKAARQVEEKKRRQTRNRDAPPPDSSDEEDASGTISTQQELKVSNRPFSCCIRQYGVKVRETDSRKADAGNRRRWARVFGLFGTRIVGL